MRQREYVTQEGCGQVEAEPSASNEQRMRAALRQRRRIQRKAAREEAGHAHIPQQLADGEPAYELNGPGGPAAGPQADSGPAPEENGPGEPTPAPGSDDGPLKSDEIVFHYASANESPILKSYQDDVNDRVTPWGLPPELGTVRLASVPGGRAVALSWPATWGPPPSARYLNGSYDPIEAKAALMGLHALSGWAKLDPDSRAALEGLLGGETNDLSRRARQNLRPQFAALSKMPDYEQAATLERLLGDKDGMPPDVEEEIAVKPVEVALSGPARKKGFEFTGKTADADSWIASYADGVKLEIVAPKTREEGLHNHSVEEAADAARYVPRVTRATIKQIVLNPVRNPPDEEEAIDFDTKVRHPYMDAMNDGVVTIYPMRTRTPLENADSMRSRLIHESGHTAIESKWGSDPTKGKWIQWQQAMDADKNSVSKYATTESREDLAETVQVYLSTKGTPRFDEYKAIVPHRFAMLEQDLK